MLVRLRESYTLAEGQVKLKVDVGEGQKAFVEVLLNERLIGQGPAIADLPVGNGADLAGAKLRVTATVTDTNKNSNRTSVSYSLSGGQANRSFVSSHEVDADGSTVDYDAIFRLL